MGFFFSEGESDHKIAHKDLKKHFDQIPILDEKEKQYLIGMFDQYEHGHITKNEIEKTIRELKADNSDIISPEEAEAVKRKLLEN